MREHLASRLIAANWKVAWWVALFASGIALVLMGMFGVGVASAHGRHGRGDGFGRGVVPAAAGIVQSTPSGGSFTIETRRGATETIDVTGSTTYLERSVSGAPLDNVATGDLVGAFGTIYGSTVTASEIVISVPRTPRSTRSTRPIAVGIVQGTPGTGSFTILTRSGSSDTIDVSSTSTSYYERGVSSPSLASVSSGDFVVVFGTASGSTITASKVVIGGAPRHRAYIVAGTVQGTPTGDVFTITAPSGTNYTVDVSSTTSYFERGVSTPSLNDVAGGDFVAVFGSLSSTTVTATKVAIATPPPSNSTFATAGTVQTTPSGGSFVIETWDHAQLTVVTSSSPTYTERGLTAASLTDVTVGENVAVFGTVSGSTVTATQIAIGGNGVGGGPGYLGGGPGHLGGGQGVHGGAPGDLGGTGSGYEIFPGGPAQGGHGPSRGHGHY
jgi:hypothetical protein